MHEAVIIGSGLGGLECGAILAREGWRVRVMEKNRRIGGCLQTFRRDGRALDTGMHYIGGLDAGQVMNQYLRYLGVRDSLDVVRMDDEGFDTVVMGDEEYPLGMGYGPFAQNLKRWFPAETRSVDNFRALLQEVGGTMSVEKLRRGVISEGAMQYIGRSAFGEIDGMFADPALKSLLAGTSLLYDGNRDKTTLYHYGMINHSFIESSYRFVGGSQQLVDALAAQIRAAGGEVRTDAEVTAIRVRDDRVVCGVELRGGEFVEASHVVSDIHPAATMELVEKTPRIKKAHLTRLRGLENSCGVFTVYLVMKRGAAPYLNRNFYIHEGGDTWRTKLDAAAGTPRNVLFNMQATARDQRFADVASILCPVDYSLFERWEGTAPGCRGAEYADFKARLAEGIVEFVARRFPWLRGAVESVHTTSPLSWRDYTASPRGSAYGIVKDHRSPFTTLIPTGTRFENLLLTGQSINVHGALGVTVTAALTCAKLLGAEYIAKKTGDA